MEGDHHQIEERISAVLATIRSLRSGDLQACRALWVELTEWHRKIYRSPDIGGPYPGHYFDEHQSACSNRHRSRINKRSAPGPVARNELAIRFFHQVGFAVLGCIELFMDFTPADQQVWQPGGHLADRDFRV